MKITTLKPHIILVLLMVFTSCTHEYYLPMKQNVKTFEQKGDLVASVNVQPMFVQCGVDLGYALTDNIGINTSYQRFNTSLYGKEMNPFIKDFLWDTELIFYKNYSFGLFGALNLGYGRGGFNVFNPYYSLGMDRFYAQPSVGYMITKHFGIAFSTRFAQTDYHLKMRTDGYSSLETDLIQSYFGLHNIAQPTLNIEPAISIISKTTYGTWKIQYINSSSRQRHIKYENLVISYSLELSRFFTRTPKE